MIYKAQHHRHILLTTNCQRRRMKNSLSDKIWTLWIFDYVIWTYQHTSIVSEIHQWSMWRVSRYLCDSSSWWHPDIFRHFWRTCATCQSSVEETWKHSAMIEIEEMQVSCSRNQVLRTLDYHQRYLNEKDKSTSNQRLARTEEHQRDSAVYWFSELLSTIFEELFAIYDPTVQAFEKETEVLLKNWTKRSIWKSKAKCHWRINIDIMWFSKAKHNWN